MRSIGTCPRPHCPAPNLRASVVRYFPNAILLSWKSYLAPQERTMTRSCIYRVRAVCPTLRSQLYALSCSVRTRNVLLYVFHKQGDGRLKCERAFSKSHTVISSARGLNLGVFVSKAHSLSLPETSAPVSFHEINPSRRWAYHLQSGIFPIVDPVFSIRSLSVSSPLSFLHHAFWGIPVP